MWRFLFARLNKKMDSFRIYSSVRKKKKKKKRKEGEKKKTYVRRNQYLHVFVFQRLLTNAFYRYVRTEWSNKFSEIRSKIFIRKKLFLKIFKYS